MGIERLPQRVLFGKGEGGKAYSGGNLNDETGRVVSKAKRFFVLQVDSPFRALNDDPAYGTGVSRKQQTWCTRLAGSTQVSLARIMEKEKTAQR